MQSLTPNANRSVRFKTITHKNMKRFNVCLTAGIALLTSSFLQATLLEVSHKFNTTPLPTPDGVIATSHGDQLGRLYRWGPPDTCAVKQTVATWNTTTTYHYETYTFVADTTGCTTVQVPLSDFGIYVALYEAVYYPYSYIQTVVGQQGSSGIQDFEVFLNEGWTYVLVIQQSNLTYVGDYTILIDNMRLPAKHSDYTTTDIANTATPEWYDLDPDNILTDGSETYTFSGTPPTMLTIVGEQVGGYFHNVGHQTFVVEGTDGHNTITHNFDVTVLEPTEPPLITSVTQDDIIYPTTIVLEGDHGTAAQTELVNLNAQLGVATSISFQWTWVKNPYIFKLVRGSPPEGMWFDNETGVLQGIPTETGEFILVVSVKDWRGRGYQWIRLVVDEAPAASTSSEIEEVEETPIVPGPASD